MRHAQSFSKNRVNWIQEMKRQVLPPASLATGVVFLGGSRQALVLHAHCKCSSQWRRPGNRWKGKISREEIPCLPPNPHYLGVILEHTGGRSFPQSIENRWSLLVANALVPVSRIITTCLLYGYLHTSLFTLLERESSLSHLYSS